MLRKSVTSLLLSVTGLLTKSSSSNVNVHLLVVRNRDRTVDTGNIFDKPKHERVAPPRCVSIRCSLVSSESNLAEGGFDKVASVGNKKAGTADLAHGGGNQMAQNKIYVNMVVGQLRGQGIAPLLKKRLATGVGCQVRGRSPAAERAHCQDQTALSRLEDRGNNLSNLESAQTVDGDNILELLLGGFEEGHRHAVALSDVVDQNGYIETTNQLGELLVIGVIILGEVHGKSLDLKTTFPKILFLKFFGESLELRFGSGNEDEIKPLGSELRGILLAETVRGTGDHGPRSGTTVFAKLARNYVSFNADHSTSPQEQAPGTHVVTREDEGAQDEAQVAEELQS